VISREVTSTAVGFVKKTFSSIIPTQTIQSVLEPSPTISAASYEDEEEEDEYTPTFYKTYFTTVSDHRLELF